MDVAAEASVGSGAFETDLSHNTFRWMKYSDSTESNMQGDAGKEISIENSEEINFCPTAGELMTKHG